jgi:hypothetical protein
MTDKLNLDIESYTKEELLHFFGCEEIHSKDYITKKYNNKLKLLLNIEDKPLKQTLNTFFTSAFKKLIEFIPRLNENNDRFLTNVPVNQNAHPTPKIVEPNIQSIQSIKYPLGTLNPIERKTQTIVFSLDTLFRKMDAYPNSNDFIYDLPVPIENVISMKLINAEIPNSAPLYSEEKHNNKLVITMFGGKEPGLNDSDLIPFPTTGKTLTIVLPDGSPGFSSMIGLINNVLDSQRNSFSFLKCGIDSISGNIFFRFKLLSECITWNSLYYSDSTGQTSFPPDNKKPTAKFKMPSLIGKTPEYNALKWVYLGSTSAENKNVPHFELSGNIEVGSTSPSYNLGSTEPLTYMINFNPSNINVIKTLGWSLGFRSSKKFEHDKSCKLSLKKLAEQNSCNTMDYKKNKISYEDFFERGHIIYNGYYSANAPYGDAEPDFLFLYVNEFVGNYNDTLLASLENSYLAKSILARIQIKSSFYSVDFISSENDLILNKTRNYFGPVNLKKLHIRLLNKFGEISNNNNANYSVTFQFETLYSSIRN